MFASFDRFYLVPHHTDAGKNSTLWPKPYYDFTQNPPTVEGFELGRKLFYDPILSRDTTISCASCHFQATGFTHVDHELSHGIDGKVGNRNALALQI